MTRRRPSLLLAAAAAALVSCARGGVAPAPVAPPAREAALTPEEALPGISLEGLTPEQKAAVAAFAQSEYCPCGCPHTVSQCLRVHAACTHAPRAARLAVRFARAGASADELRKLVVDYYASFDERKRLDTASFGPPLGDPKAPIAIVEYSDFACPFCQSLHPVLEKFVADNAGRVKLFYKPFPLRYHPHAEEAAEAGEWARANGLFWKMHDAMFGQPGALAPDDLVALARQLGGDGDDLAKAIETSRYEDRIVGSQNEARAAGLTATPTLFFDGRRYALPDYSPEMLQWTLEDEEEWMQGHGWKHD